MNLDDLGQCEIKKDSRHNMENAGLMVGIDLQNPIDCSQMDIMEISDMAVMEEDSLRDYGRMHVKRTTVLRARVFNDAGEEEELTITFELKSDRHARLKK